MSRSLSYLLVRRNELLVWDAEHEDVLVLPREAVLLLSVLAYKNASLVIEVPSSKVLWSVTATPRRRGADDDHILVASPSLSISAKCALLRIAFPVVSEWCQYHSRILFDKGSLT